VSTLHINVGGSLAASRARLLDAVARHEAGADVAEHHVTFDNWETFAKAMTPNRLALLRHVHTTPPRSILALAKALGRDYRRVHDDGQSNPCSVNSREAFPSVQSLKRPW